jgi:hypothetical protein
VLRLKFPRQFARLVKIQRHQFHALSHHHRQVVALDHYLLLAEELRQDQSDLDLNQHFQPIDQSLRLQTQIQI